MFVCGWEMLKCPLMSCLCPGDNLVTTYRRCQPVGGVHRSIRDMRGVCLQEILEVSACGRCPPI